MALTNKVMNGSSELDGDRARRKIPNKTWRMLNLVKGDQDGDVGWMAYSPPQKRGSDSQSDSQSSQSQGNDNGVQISPSVILGDVEKRRAKLPPVPVRKNRANTLIKHPSFEEQYKASLRPLRKRPKKTDIIAWDEEITETETNTAVPTKQGTPPEEFPDDDFDDELILATQAFEAKQNPAVAETPKRSVPRVSARRNDFQSKQSSGSSGDSDERAGSASSGGSALNEVNLTSLHLSAAPKTDDNAFSDDDDDLFTQLAIPEA